MEGRNGSSFALLFLLICVELLEIRIALDTKYIKRITVFLTIFFGWVSIKERAEISQEQRKIVCRVVARGS